jgi:hypothetical protein
MELIIFMRVHTPLPTPPPPIISQQIRLKEPLLTLFSRDWPINEIIKANNLSFMAYFSRDGSILERRERNAKLPVPGQYVHQLMEAWWGGGETFGWDSSSEPLLHFWFEANISK